MHIFVRLSCYLIHLLLSGIQHREGLSARGRHHEASPAAVVPARSTKELDRTYQSKQTHTYAHASAQTPSRGVSAHTITRRQRTHHHEASAHTPSRGVSAHTITRRQLQPWTPKNWPVLFATGMQTERLICTQICTRANIRVRTYVPNKALRAFIHCHIQHTHHTQANPHTTWVEDAR